MAQIHGMVFISQTDEVVASDGADGTPRTDWIRFESNLDRNTLSLSIGQTDSEQVKVADNLIAALQTIRSRALARLAKGEAATNVDAAIIADREPEDVGAPA